MHLLYTFIFVIDYYSNIGFYCLSPRYWNNMIMANNSKSETDWLKKKFKDGTMSYERGYFPSFFNYSNYTSIKTNLEMLSYMQKSFIPIFYILTIY